MRLLLDTHTFLWLDGSPERLSPAALAACEDPTNELYLSVVSAWEIQIKHQINRLQLDVPLEEMIQDNRRPMISRSSPWNCPMSIPYGNFPCITMILLIGC
jgi:PIN domain nuclease of toxin-antitoxin system